jgi:glutaredoxin 3
MADTGSPSDDAPAPRVVMYGKWGCGFCLWAQRLLERRGVAVEHINVSFRPASYREMVQRSGGRTSAPQIFIGDVHVGGYRELVDLERSGELERLLEEVGA